MILTNSLQYYPQMDEEDEEDEDEEEEEEDSEESEEDGEDGEDGEEDEEDEDKEDEEDEDEEEEDEVNNEGNPPPRKANLSVASKSMLGEIDRQLDRKNRKIANSVAKANEMNAARNKGAEVRYGKIWNDT